MSFLRLNALPGPSSCPTYAARIVSAQGASCGRSARSPPCSPPVFWPPSGRHWRGSLCLPAPLLTSPCVQVESVWGRVCCGLCPPGASERAGKRKGSAATRRVWMLTRCCSEGVGSTRNSRGAFPHIRAGPVGSGGRGGRCASSRDGARDRRCPAPRSASMIIRYSIVLDSTIYLYIKR